MRVSQQTLIRAVSALVVLGILFTLYQFFQVRGVTWFAIAAVFTVQIEYAQMMLKERLSLKQRIFFVSACAGTLLSALYVPNKFLIVFSFLSLFVFINCFFTAQRHGDLSKTLESEGLLSLGLLYCGFLPYYAIQLLFLEQGLIWFGMLLMIIFVGDITAYFIGRRWGRHKLWPMVSPSKTWEGAIGGLGGSLLAGLVMGLVFFPQIPMGIVVIVSALTGASGQIGDLFESMIKRVAGVKDSGNIMPGHGGLMDRIDGVLFGGPLMLLLASELARWYF